MRCSQRCSLVVLLLCVLLAGLAFMMALNASAWLSRPDPLVKADVILVLGSDPTRAFEAADLYRDGFAPRILLSRPKRRERFIYLESQGICVPWFEVAGHKILRDRGVPEQAIATFGEDLVSTAAEAHAAAAALPGVHRLIIVTSPYHVRRARLVFRNAFRGADVRFADNHYEPLPRAWWTEEDPAMEVTTEIIKIVYYEFGGRMMH